MLVASADHLQRRGQRRAGPHMHVLCLCHLQEHEEGCWPRTRQHVCSLMSTIRNGMNRYVPLHIAQAAYLQVSDMIWMP